MGGVCSCCANFARWFFEGAINVCVVACSIVAFVLYAVAIPSRNWLESKDDTEFNELGGEVNVGLWQVCTKATNPDDASISVDECFNLRDLYNVAQVDRPSSLTSAQSTSIIAVGFSIACMCVAVCGCCCVCCACGGDSGKLCMSIINFILWLIMWLVGGACIGSYADYRQNEIIPFRDFFIERGQDDIAALFNQEIENLSNYDFKWSYWLFTGGVAVGLAGFVLVCIVLIIDCCVCCTPKKKKEKKEKDVEEAVAEEEDEEESEEEEEESEEEEEEEASEEEEEEEAEDAQEDVEAAAEKAE